MFQIRKSDRKSHHAGNASKTDPCTFDRFADRKIFPLNLRPQLQFSRAVKFPQWRQMVRNTPRCQRHPHLVALSPKKGQIHLLTSMSHFATSFDEDNWDFDMDATIVSDKPDIDSHLAQMGLASDDLIRVIRFAESERALCTDNDPVGFPNMVAYARAGRRLRELLAPKGWEKDDTNNQCAVRNPKTKIRIVPCNFDDGAGNRLQTPSNKSPKGEVSRRKSLCNRTAWLPGFVPVEAPVDADGYETWLLGMFIDDNVTTRAELSLPVDFDGSYFTQFGKRIILLDDSEEHVAERSDDDVFEIIDIPVKRK